MPVNLEKQLLHSLRILKGLRVTSQEIYKDRKEIMRWISVIPRRVFFVVS
jgi:hypothetical protein